MKVRLAACWIAAAALAFSYPPALHATADGALDPSFAAGTGTIQRTLDAGEIALPFAIRVGIDGELTMAGVHRPAGSSTNTMWMCTMPQDGTSITCSDPRDGVAKAVAVQLDGRRVLAGSANGSSLLDVNMAFAGIVADASNALDTSFSGDGKKGIDFTGFAEANAIDARRNGDLLFSGTYNHEATATGTGNDCIVGRMGADGTLDTAFSGNGLLAVGWDFGPDADDECFGQTLFHDGSLAIVGEVQRADSAFSFGIARITADGNLDSGFSGNGKTVVSFATPGDSDSGSAIAHDRFGRILVTGLAASSTRSSGDFGAIARLLPNGTLDPSFGIGGKVTFEIGNTAPDVLSIASIVVLPPPSNDIAVAGSYEGASHQLGFVAVFHQDGSYDTSFSGNGRVGLDLDANRSNGVTGLTAQGGKLVAASGYLEPRTIGSPTGAFAVHRLYRKQVFGDDFEGGNLFLWSNRADP